MKRLHRGPRAACLTIVVAALSCRTGNHGHEHDDGHEHAADGDTAEREPPSLTITRWSPRYELFVELPAPAPAQPVSYHAHVTDLRDFSPVTEGTLRVRYRSSSGIAEEHAHTGVKRPGIFVFEGPAPAAGNYALEMVYERASGEDVFDCGPVTIASPPVAPDAEASASAITFPKESQWKIPFGTDWAEKHPLASELELPATIEPAGGDQLTIGAPTGGRFFHNADLALAEGLRIKKGDVLGSIAPTVAGDDFSRLESAVQEARLARAQVQREIDRIKPLVTQGLLPARRLVELENEAETQSARLAASSGRLRQVVAPGRQGGLTIHSTLDGIVAQVLVANGAPVEGGAPLVQISGTRHSWIRTRFVAKPAALLQNPMPTALRLPSGERIDIGRMGARFLSALPVIDPASQIATWIVDLPAASPADAVSHPSPARRLPELRPGGTAVLIVRLGQPESLSSVQREAVTEINTRPYVFVQVDGERFERRLVSLGRSDGPWVQVISGVDRGERVVTRGGYDIHLAALMGRIDSHRH